MYLQGTKREKSEVKIMGKEKKETIEKKKQDALNRERFIRLANKNLEDEEIEINLSYEN